MCAISYGHVVLQRRRRRMRAPMPALAGASTPSTPRGCAAARALVNYHRLHAADIDRRTRHGDTALMIASRVGNTPNVKALPAAAPARHAQ